MVEASDKYKSLAKKLVLSLIPEESQLTIFSIINISMGVVEALRKKEITSDEKKQLALSLLPLIIDVIVDLDRLSHDQGEELKQKIKENKEYIEDFIDAAAWISNHPEVINAGKWVLKESKTCFKSCLSLLH